MFINGIIAILQILFLPGLIFFALFKPKGGFFFKLSAVIAISMLANATILYPLALLHIYTKPVIVGLLACETIALIWLYRGMLKINLEGISQSLNAYSVKVWNELKALFDCENSSSFIKFLRGCLVVITGGLAVSLVFWFFKRLTNGFGSVFNTWDAVVSWNAWAETWAQNIVPSIHLTYPQLLPLNLSITYLMTGNYQVVFFAKAIMPIFALLTVLMLFELALEKKHYGYFVAVILVYLTYKKFLGEYISEGYADIPVAFMALTALVPYLRSEDFLKDQKDVILSMILAAAAAMTKQVGVFILVLLPILALITRKTKEPGQIKRLLLWFGIGVVLILPWYLPMGIRVLKDFSQLGMDQYIGHSTQVQSTSSPILRIGQAFIHLGKYMALYLFMVPAFFLVKPRYRWLIVLFILPFSILWGIVASYSERNLSITFVPVAVICGLGLESLLDYVLQLLGVIKLGRLGAVFLLLLVILPVGFFAIKLDDQSIIKSWTKAQKQIFSPEINEQLYALDRSDPNCKKIITNYPIQFLPGFETMQVNSYFNDYGVYKKLVSDPEVCWMLVPGSTQQGVENEINQNLTNGTYQLLFSTTKWVPYRLIKVR